MLRFWPSPRNSPSGLCVFWPPIFRRLPFWEHAPLSLLSDVLRLPPWALYPFLVGVLSAAAAIRKLPYTILTLVSQRFETGGRRCSVRPHTVRRPRLALGEGAATESRLRTDGWAFSDTVIYICIILHTCIYTKNKYGHGFGLCLYIGDTLLSSLSYWIIGLGLTLNP